MNSHQSDQSFKIHRVSFLNSDAFEFDYMIYEMDIQSDIIIAKYKQDVQSSVWISSEANYRQFAQKFEVISGGWYGPQTGGRWRTLKRYFGELHLTRVTDLNQELKSEKSLFRIRKPFFKTRFVVDLSNNAIGTMTFRCSEIIVKPAEEVFFLNRETRNFEDMTELLTENGMRLIEGTM